MASLGVNLSDNQKRKLAEGIANRSPITIRLLNHQLTGPYPLMLNKTHLNKIKKAMAGRSLVDIKISKTQIRKVVREGSGIFSSLIPLATGALPTIGKTL